MTTSHAIFDAIRNDDLARLQVIVSEQPESIRLTDERGTSPLTLAAYLGKLPLTKALVAGGADVNARDSTGSALMGASFKGYVDIARYLIDSGADLEATNVTGGTALSFAAMFNQVATVDLLLERGADAGAKDLEGQSPADLARRNGFTELADRLEQR